MNGVPADDPTPPSDDSGAAGAVGPPDPPHPRSIGGGNVFEEEEPAGPGEFELELPPADEDYGTPWLPVLFVFGAALALLIPASRIRRLVDVIAVVIAAVAVLLAAWAASLFRRLPKKRHSLRTLIAAQLFLMATLGVIYFEVKREGFRIPQSVAQAVLGGLLVWSLTSDLRTFVPRKTVAPPSWREIKKKISATKGAGPGAGDRKGGGHGDGGERGGEAGVSGGSMPAGSDGPPDDSEEGAA